MLEEVVDMTRAFSYFGALFCFWVPLNTKYLSKFSGDEACSEVKDTIIQKWRKRQIFWNIPPTLIGIRSWAKGALHDLYEEGH